MVKVEAVVIRERIETVIDAVESATGHVGVTVIEAVGHGRQRGVTHEYRGRIFESRFLPKAVLTFIVEDDIAGSVVDAIVDAARSGNESGDGIVWTIQSKPFGAAASGDRALIERMLDRSGARVTPNTKLVVEGFYTRHFSVYPTYLSLIIARVSLPNEGRPHHGAILQPGCTK